VSTPDNLGQAKFSGLAGAVQSAMWTLLRGQFEGSSELGVGRASVGP
jgi:hypothetical protein